jgi:Zn-dependent protease
MDVINAYPLSPAHSNSPFALGAVLLLQIFFELNFTLGVFNLLPIPPLDGSGILTSVLPPSFEAGIESLNRFGFILLYIAMFTGVLGAIFAFVMPLAIDLVFIGRN